MPSLKYLERFFKFYNMFVMFIFIIMIFSVSVEAATYYVNATGGNNSNDGLSVATAWKTIGKVKSTSFSPGDYILFKRGEVWREQLVPRSGDSSGYITYGAYGTGNKPLLLGSVTKNNVSDWTDEGGNIWTASGITYDVGNIIFNNETSTGVKVRNESELDTQGEFWYDEANFILKLYSGINPALYYSNIECALKRHIILQGGQSYVIYENLDLRYGGAHGISATSNVHNTIVRDSDFSFIGGARQYGEVRYGNGIEFWDGAHDTVVERCRLREIYDAALTSQGASNNYNQIFRYNVVWNSEYCFEFWNHSAAATLDNIYFTNNTCVNAGHGWGHDQRWGEPAGWDNGRHLAFFNNIAVTTNIQILNNIFYESKNELFFLHDSWDDDMVNVVLDYNIWYQSSGRMIDYSCSYALCTEDEIYTMAQFAEYQLDTGNDANSLATDPLFNDILNNDYRPSSGSPACALSDTGNYVGALPCVDPNDTDGDGMPDSYESLYGFNPNDPDDANYDNDTDGLSNLSEYILGTDPTDPDTDGDSTLDGSDICPFTWPVNAGGTDYASLQIAYVNSAGGIIRSQDTVFTEDLTFAMNKSVILEVGYDCDYLSPAGSTTVTGDMIISDGNVTLQYGSLEIN